MDNNQAKITISLNEGKFEISGSELFVTQQIENFKSVIERTLTDFDNKEKQVKANSSNNGNSSTKTEKPADENVSADDISEIHPDVYAIDNEKINIICDIPGSTDSKKTLNASLLYAYGQKSQGINETHVEDIRNICKIHACLDSANFSSHIKTGNPKLYIDKGSGKSRTITITRPGEKAAKELIKSIESNG
ncbi:hypothetical protein KO506_06920 [Polaribacter vadi]|uniref:hypothetical protein n=1 Tax=Polaribacter TaxID=52959 RepID=UPI001C082DA5|nr:MULTISPECIES: hypothetical protein [Polaribacter]MBU3011128.1 hypothetical protein [Polaribacter vadi]MDO6740942.1 hypothetical protein [Polaribacter sp. 1_MG-2023]